MADEKKAEAVKAASRTTTARQEVGRVVITHPDLKDADGKPVTHETTEKAFASAHSKRGWTKVETQKVGG